MKINPTPFNLARLAFQRQLGTGLLAAGLTWSASAQTATEASSTNLLAQSVQTISRVEAAQQAQAETLQKLLERIDQLEKKSADEKAEAEKVKLAYEEQRQAHIEREKKLQGKIGELEGKVGSLEAGRVLPEIALPTDDTPTTTELQQQVRIAAGAIVFTGVLLAQFVNPNFIWLSGFVGAGLVFAGITDFCGMGLLLAKMPWNKRR